MDRIPAIYNDAMREQHQKNVNAIADAAQANPDVLPKGAKQSRNYTPAQREVIVAKLAERYLRGGNLATIAREVGISTVTAANYMRVLEERWRRNADATYAQARSRELAKLDHLEETYWSSWEESLKGARKDERIVVPTGETGPDGRDRVAQKRHKISTEETYGDPRFLEGVFKCIDRRIKLLGLDAAERDAMGGKGRDIGNALEERLRRYAVVFAGAIVGDTHGHSADDGPGQPVDSDRSPREASGVLDVSYVDR